MSIHVSYDLEALGEEYGAVIIAIGACKFDPRGRGPVGPTFYTNVSAASHQNLGGRIDARTVMWWLKQENAARAALTSPPPVELRDALNAYSKWYKGATDDAPPDVMWSHLYDIQLLRAAFLLCRISLPWGAREWGDLHTLFRLAGWSNESYKKFRDEAAARVGGVKHNALDDAVRQAHMIQDAYTTLFPHG